MSLQCVLRICMVFFYFLLDVVSNDNHDIFQYSTLVDDVTIEKHLYNHSFTLVTILNDLHSGDRFSEYINLLNQLVNIDDLTVLHTRKDSKKKFIDKYNLTYTDMPLYLLFHAKDPKPLVYKSSWKADDIIRWIIKTTGLHLPLPGCIQTFDKLAHAFHQSKIKAERERLISEMKKLSNSYSLEKLTKYVQYYVYIAEKIIDYGEDFIRKESARIKKLIDSQISDNQKSEMKKKLNIITQFGKPTYYKSYTKTEL